MYLKAIYENMLVELPFASFFLSKILGRHSANVDIDHLNSLDPVLYRYVNFFHLNATKICSCGVIALKSMFFAEICFH